jgi:hypothetical protein
LLFDLLYAASGLDRLAEQGLQARKELLSLFDIK